MRIEEVHAATDLINFSMKIMKTRRKKITLLASALLMSTPFAVAAPVSLVCKMERAEDTGEVNMSVILEESARRVTINGQIFTEVKYESYRITGAIRTPDVRVTGISRKMSFSLDRLTGKFALISLPEVSDGSDPSEAQKAAFNSLPPDPTFMGACAPGAPKF